MIKITNKIRNNKSLCNVIHNMNKKDKGFRHYDCKINLSRYGKNRRYMNLLETASKLDAFTWEELLLKSDLKENVINCYARNYEYYAERCGKVTFHEYATNYFNGYKTFFRNG